ncbi:hypothetical protein ACTDI4_19690 [Mesorhizobium sp. PUT5]|uniref:hypothetical protein n=1 Tax=Mesorhizobium sp. PUT5 TaxID=3454629 RepID=UPI003FA45EC5
MSVLKADRVECSTEYSIGRREHAAAPASAPLVSGTAGRSPECFGRLPEDEHIEQYDYDDRHAHQPKNKSTQHFVLP